MPGAAGRTPRTGVSEAVSCRAEHDPESLPLEADVRAGEGALGCLYDFDLWRT